MDALLADNFSAQKQGVKHIVYMSGLIPENDELSAHLRSRLECEKFLVITVYQLAHYVQV